jgi:hypothetical protein
MMRTTIASGLTAALLLVGCAEVDRTTATEETLLRATATVDSVDQATRQVQLRDNAGGGAFTVTAGPEVRNLPQLAAGDEVQVDYYQSRTLAMAEPSDTGEPVTIVAGARAPEGELPGGLVATTTSMVVTLLSYDSGSGLATFRSPDGLTRQTVVRPEMRSFAGTLDRGSRVQVTMTEAVAVTIIIEPEA